jgi:hypothetical protein
VGTVEGAGASAFLAARPAFIFARCSGLRTRFLTGGVTTACLATTLIETLFVAAPVAEVEAEVCSAGTPSKKKVSHCRLPAEVQPVTSHAAVTIATPMRKKLRLNCILVGLNQQAFFWGKLFFAAKGINTDLVTAELVDDIDKKFSLEAWGNHVLEIFQVFIIHHDLGWQIVEIPWIRFSKKH